MHTWTQREAEQQRQKEDLKVTRKKRWITHRADITKLAANFLITVMGARR